MNQPWTPQDLALVVAEHEGMSLAFMSDVLIHRVPRDASYSHEELALLARTALHSELARVYALQASHEANRLRGISSISESDLAYACGNVSPNDVVEAGDLV
ncbi:hypothetical protein [Changpingibacter yushuensis]|uniref:hypothetical protein n=1 Tax=Changpingibacter yushuensis TaxID=2758440 RepID=UPI0015F7545B|nr:hypothetical protein [Changpingibacter yushuensis]